MRKNPTSSLSWSGATATPTWSRPSQPSAPDGPPTTSKSPLPVVRPAGCVADEDVQARRAGDPGQRRLARTAGGVRPRATAATAARAATAATGGATMPSAVARTARRRPAPALSTTCASPLRHHSTGLLRCRPCRREAQAGRAAGRRRRRRRRGELEERRRRPAPAAADAGVTSSRRARSTPAASWSSRNSSERIASRAVTARVGLADDVAEHLERQRPAVARLERRRATTPVTSSVPWPGKQRKCRLHSSRFMSSRGASATCRNPIRSPGYADEGGRRRRRGRAGGRCRRRA